MKDLIEYLKEFNSKERFYLVGHLLGNPSFSLAETFRKDLSAKFDDLPIPVDAFSAMDYHIDWIYASLTLAAKGETADKYSNAERMIKAQQEDVDWLIVFRRQSDFHIILIEAKGVTSWNNKQMASKAKRFRDIFGDAGDRWAGVIPHFVLMSPLSLPPDRLKVEKWPRCMAPKGKFAWLPLTVPEGLNSVCRCNNNLHKDRKGQNWKVVGRNSK